MDDLSLHKRLYYRWLGLAYGFTYWTSQRTFIFRLSTWVKLLAFVPLILFWQRNLGVPVLLLGLLLGLAVMWLYWRARRVGYKKFVVKDTAVTPTDLTPINANQRISLLASGIFGVGNREEQILQQPTEYWQVPLGDHTLMAQPEPGRFLYQFFNAASLRDLQSGWLICGIRPLSVLAVTFNSAWGNDHMSLRELYQGSEDNGRSLKRRTVYLNFATEADEQAVRDTILFDARERRKSQSSSEGEPIWST
jgi:hypothetical protein